MELGIRLSAVADLIRPTDTLADVGCDHGYLSVYLIEKKRCKKMIAMDIRKGPLERAKQTIEKYGCGAYIEARLSDGIRQLKIGEAQGYACAGMGGKLALQIMYQDREKVALMQQVILQPQSELWLVRRMLLRWGMCVEEERMVFEDGKYYPLMRIRPDKNFAMVQPITQETFLEGYTEDNWKHYAAELYGLPLLECKDPVLKDFLKKECLRLRDIRESLINGKQTGQRMERLAELEKEIYIAESALAFFYEQE